MTESNKIAQGNVRGRDDISEVCVSLHLERMPSIGGAGPHGGDSSSPPACHCRAAEGNNVEQSGMSGPEPPLAKHVVWRCVCRVLADGQGITNWTAYGGIWNIYLNVFVMCVLMYC